MKAVTAALLLVLVTSCVTATQTGQCPSDSVGVMVPLSDNARKVTLELLAAVRDPHRDEIKIEAFKHAFAKAVAPDVKRFMRNDALGTAQVVVAAPGAESRFPVFYGWYNGDCTGDWYWVDDLGGIHHIVKVNVPGCYFV
jgi:hypothetical protein